MAKDMKNATPVAPAAAETLTDEQLLVIKKKRKKLIITIVSVVLLLSLMAGTTLVVLNIFSTPSVPEEGEVVTAAADKKPAIYYALKPAFIVNFQQKGRTRYLQADLTLLVRDADVTPALDMHMPLIRNNLVLLLSSQDFEALQTPEGKESLREQALIKVQEVLQEEIGKPGVEQVLFTSFVMQ